MEASEAALERPGLRERKKQQTRDRIARVALELFAEKGYEHTTLAEIAEAADVSTRTIFAYFESKEHIVFCEKPPLSEQLEQVLEQRPEGVTTIDALRDFITKLSPPDETVRLRKKLIANDEGLRLAERARFAQVEEAFAKSIARDLDAEPGDIRPPIVAASMTAAFTSARDRLEATTGEPATPEQAMAILDEVLDFLRGGLDGLRRG